MGGGGGKEADNCKLAGRNKRPRRYRRHVHAPAPPATAAETALLALATTAASASGNAPKKEPHSESATVRAAGSCGRYSNAPVTSRRHRLQQMPDETRDTSAVSDWVSAPRSGWTHDATCPCSATSREAHTMAGERPASFGACHARRRQREKIIVTTATGHYHCRWCSEQSNDSYHHGKPPSPAMLTTTKLRIQHKQNTNTNKTPTQALK